MKKIIPIIRLAGKFTMVHRAVLNREGRFENDAEHSYQLALVCWEANKQYDLGLSDELILKFALVHDLVEVYAGDTDSHGDKDKLAAKKENEAKALDRLKGDYTEYTSILAAIEQYQQFHTVEAQLVNVMDKLLPTINIHDSNDPYCFEHKLDSTSWTQWLVGKLKYDSLDPRLQKIVDEGIAEITINYKDMFPPA